jgi:hypothetical protein
VTSALDRSNSEDDFGFSVAISGETVVVGAHGDVDVAQGSAYVFVRSGGVWSQQQKLEASDAAAEDDFGFSVAISGETVVVGAPSDDGAAGSDQGSAYVFVPALNFSGFFPPIDNPPAVNVVNVPGQILTEREQGLEHLRGGLPRVAAVRVQQRRARGRHRADGHGRRKQSEL